MMYHEKNLTTYKLSHSYRTSMLAMLPTNLDTASVISTVGTMRGDYPGCKMLLLCSNNLENIPEVAIYKKILGPSLDTTIDFNTGVQCCRA